jgi:hypothetical protein
MVVQTDVVGLCGGCTTPVQRAVTYQVLNFDKSPVGAVPVCEVVTTNNYSCLSPSPFPGFKTTQCSAPRNTTSGGMFSDVWTLGGDAGVGGYIVPAGATTCGVGVVDTRYWSGSAISFLQELGNLVGVVDTTQINIYVGDNISKMPMSMVIPH